MRHTYPEFPTPAAIQNMGEHVQIVLHLSNAEAAAIGSDIGDLVSWFGSALDALVALRAGFSERETTAGRLEAQAADLNTWYWAINDLEYRLAPRLRGIRDAAIRAHAATPGGTVQHLATAMDVPRSTAQARREKVLASPRSSWEVWACGDRNRLPFCRGTDSGEHATCGDRSPHRSHHYSPAEQD